MRNKKNIGVFGLWHLGCIYATSLASKGFNVKGYDFDETVVKRLQKNIPPLFEPGLEDILKKFNGKNLHFIIEENEFFKNLDYLFITHDLPVDDKDLIQISIIDKTFSLLAKKITSYTTIVISSQIPVGTSSRLVKMLEKNNIKNPKVIYFPENLRLGQAFVSFLTPDRIVLGSENIGSIDTFIEDFSFLNCPFITMNLESAEMTKHALNSYLATCISFSSEISDLAEKVGANMSDIVKALKTDRRVSQYTPINPGLGFAGGTLGRDIKTLKKISNTIKYQPKLLNAVYDVNQDRIPMLISKLHSIYPSLRNKSIGILGLTYKPNTDTLRRSMSLELIKKLKNKGCKIKAYDPTVSKNIEGYHFVEVCNSVSSFFRDLDIVILMTDWSEFRSIDPSKVKSMSKKIIVDTKNFLDKQKYEGCGFKVLRIGEK